MAIVKKEIKRVTMRVNNTTRGLPAEYQEVEWIGNSGTQYIDTGVGIKNHIVIANIEYTAFNGWMTIGSVLGNSGSLYYRLYGGYGNDAHQWSYGFLNSYDNYGGSVSLNTKYELEVSTISGNMYFKHDGTTYGSSSETYSISSDGQFGVLANRDPQSWQIWDSAKVYDYKIYDDTDTLIRDFVPCYRKADDVIGMYDVVNDVFYTNSGTGTFTKGADVPDMVEKQIRPNEIQVNDYIPVMDSNSQDGFVASGSNTLGGTDDAWLAFHPSVEGGTDYTWHSPSIGNKQWVYTQIHIPDSIIVNGITIGARKNWSGGSQNARPIYGFKLEGSNDGTNRTEIHSETALSRTRGEVKSWTITGQTTAYTWLKLNIQSTSTYVAFDFWNVNGIVK